MYIFSSGAKFEGEFYDGKMNGRGVYTWRNGDRHIAKWKKNKELSLGWYFFNRKKDDRQNPRDGRLNILSSTMSDLPTITNIPTTPPVPPVLDSRRKVVKPVLKSSPGPRVVVVYNLIPRFLLEMILHMKQAQ